MTLIVRSGYTTTFADPDVQAYITAVEEADNAALEYRTAVAIDEFVRGCKADGIWTAIKASCILAGARTLTGALVPLVGTAPTNVGPFVSGDYNRKTGLVGDGSTKYLNSNRNNNADPQDSKHASVYMTTHHSRDVTRGVLGTAQSGGSFTGATQLLTSATARTFRANMAELDATVALETDSATTAGFWGASRTSSTSLTGRYNSITLPFTSTNSARHNETIDLFRRGLNYSDARLAFYSIGESLNLALLDARVSALITAFGVAIP